MSTLTLTFAFDQDEINKLIKSGAEEENILVSILSAKEKPDSKSNLFLAAQLGDPKTNAPVIKLNSMPPVGCPVPPGWSTLDPEITHEKLNGLPKFIIPAAEKKQLLSTNSAAPNDKLLASVEGFMVDGILQTRVSFKINNTGISAVGGEVL